jgi:hypothetical protein
MAQTLEERLKKIERGDAELLKLFPSLVKASGNAMYTSDFMIIGAIKRTLSLSQGFRTHIRDRNFICAGTLEGRSPGQAEGPRQSASFRRLSLQEAGGDLSLGRRGLQAALRVRALLQPAHLRVGDECRRQRSQSFFSDISARSDAARGGLLRDRGRLLRSHAHYRHACDGMAHVAAGACDREHGAGHGLIVGRSHVHYRPLFPPKFERLGDCTMVAGPKTPSLYSRIQTHGTLTERPQDVPDARFALPSTIHWMRAFAILVADQRLAFAAGRTFYAKVQARSLPDRELNCCRRRAPQEHLERSFTSAGTCSCNTTFSAHPADDIVSLA